MNPIERLRSVLCDPEGKCCIHGSDEDRRIVDEALRDMAEAWRASREAGDVDGTPRTDEQERSAASMATYPGKVVKSGFARLLEIELKAERQTTKQLADRLSAPTGDTVQVPREPTQVMCQAGQEKAREWPKFPLRISAIYRAMLAAAPSAQKGEEAQSGSADAGGRQDG